MRPLSAPSHARVEPVAVSDVPRFTRNQVVVAVAIGREYFEADGTTLCASIPTLGGQVDPREDIAGAIEEAMRELKARGPRS